MKAISILLILFIPAICVTLVNSMDNSETLCECKYETTSKRTGETITRTDTTVTTLRYWGVSGDESVTIAKCTPIK